MEIKRILIVDDNKEILNLIRRIISNHFKNSEIYTATCGEDGIKIFNNASIDIIITDYKMNAITGLELTRIIRAVNSNIPVIAITGEQNDNILEKLKNAGANYVIFKPFQMEELINIMKNFLNSENIETTYAK